MTKKPTCLKRLRLVFPKLLAGLFLAGGLFHCGPIEISGGSSEIGNPKVAMQPKAESDTSKTEIDGFSINSAGQPIRLVRKKGQVEK